jgi:uncharacterized protein (TIGR02117 family)
LAIGSSLFSERYTVPDEVGSTTRGAGFLAAVAAVVALAAGCAASVAEHPPPSGGPTRAVWVVDHGWHTAIVVRRDDVDPALWPEAGDFPQAALVEVAWGDRDFYMAQDPTGWLAIKAAFFTSGSVLHVAGFAESTLTRLPENAVVELAVSRPGFDAMTRFFHDEYQADADGRSVRVGRGLYGTSWFYAARSRYHLFNTCNTWVARALQRTGLDVTPAGTVTAGAVMHQVRQLGVSR